VTDVVRSHCAHGPWAQCALRVLARTRLVHLGPVSDDVPPSVLADATRPRTGRIHAFLTGAGMAFSWVSWCGCGDQLPLWQACFDEWTRESRPDDGPPNR